MSEIPAAVERALPRVIHQASELRSFSRSARSAGQTISLVPTMGCLHEGHLSLMRAASQRSQVVIVSIFVNPTQFGPDEDFERYPRALDEDLMKCASAGVDVVYAPSVEEVYPVGHATSVRVAGPSEGLCGAHRPGHFEGVATVVTKLFHAAEPDLAVFGEKDYQQLVVIRRMTRDLGLGVEIVGMPIVREPDGLAMSSRNKYLSPTERESALLLSRGLGAATRAWDAGERSATALEGLVIGVLENEPRVELEYCELRAAGDLAEVGGDVRRAVLLLAARVGATRLIDNVVLGRYSRPSVA